MSVDPRLFTLYTEAEVARIAADLGERRQIETRFNYVGAGAGHWADMAAWMLTVDGANRSLRETLALLDVLRPWLLATLDPRRQTRVVDLGPGDGTPAAALLGMLPAGTEYVGVDISAQLLAVAARNLAGRRFVPVRRDFESESLDDLVAPPGTQTVVLLTGGTLCNTADPAGTLRRVAGLMRPGDVLLCGVRLDHPESRTSFALAPGDDDLAPHEQVVLDLLGITPGGYVPERGYDPERRERYIRVRLTASVEVDFGAGRVVRIGRGERVRLWRYHHRSHGEMRALIAAAGLAATAEASSADGQFLLVGAVRGSGPGAGEAADLAVDARLAGEGARGDAGE
ncbi:L-histidine N(alpha)-methyltransferase [Dactylosporangium sp. CS-047395]|uniref:L-histidine N(alpha)-methyltransferase n=1 Tax=Dactylosporangium sp. CS-047395 TaxID=3239936 RepID=UPI003D92F6F2